MGCGVVERNLEMAQPTKKDKMVSIMTRLQCKITLKMSQIRTQVVYAILYLNEKKL